MTASNFAPFVCAQCGRMTPVGFACGTAVICGACHAAVSAPPLVYDPHDVVMTGEEGRIARQNAEIASLKAKLSAAEKKLDESEDELDGLKETIRESFPAWVSDDGEADPLNEAEIIEQASGIVARHEGCPAKLSAALASAKGGEA